jgi:energy-converting hydrogenase Eha subunit F
MRVRYATALAVAAALLVPVSLSLKAQTPAPAPAQAPVLKKSAPPLRGTAELGFVQTAKLEGNTIVTTFQVKNMSATNALVGLQISEFWYDKAGNPLQGTGDRQRLRAPLQPLDVATITLRSPKVAGMTTPQYKFEQNNGSVKPVSMKQVKVLKPGPTS